MKENLSSALSLQMKDLQNKDISGLLFEMFPFEKLLPLKTSGKRYNSSR